MASGSNLMDLCDFGLNSGDGKSDPENSAGHDLNGYVKTLQDDMKAQHERIQMQQAELEQISSLVADLAMQVGSLVQEVKGKDDVKSGDKNKSNSENNKGTCKDVGDDSDTRRKSDVEILAEVLSRHHSNKLSPEPETFTLQSGKSLSRFFGKFEQYCISKFNTNTYEQWTSELGKFLKDELLDVFKANGGTDLEYSDMKSVLLQYASDSYETVENRKYELFLQAKPAPGEKLYIFALRLEKLFISVYPEVSVEKNIELKTKFLQAIPSSVAKEIENECCLVKIVNPGTEVTWSGLKNLLRVKNGAIEIPASTRDKNPSIWYNSAEVSTPFYNPNVPPPGHVPSKNKVIRPFSYGSAAPNQMSVQPVEFVSSNLPHNNSAASPINQYMRIDNHLTCSWCSKSGHHYDFCRRRLNLCLRCGNPNHKVVDCPRQPSKSQPLN